MLTAKRLYELLKYEAEKGVFTWLVRQKGVRPDMRAGSLSPKGYLLIAIDGHRYFAHRLAWLYVNGTLPHGEIDHIDGCRNNNRISNLRIVTRSENMQNERGARVNSTTCILGVSAHGKKFRARIEINRRNIHLGTFDTKEQAQRVYLDAKKKLHPAAIRCFEEVGA